MRILILLLLGCLPIGLSAQQTTNLDSLLTVLPTLEEGKEKVDVYQAISAHYLVTKIDSSLHFAEKGLQLARKLDYHKGIIKCLNIKGNYNERKTDYPKALAIYEKALAVSRENKDTMGLAVVFNNIAIVHTRMANYDKALQLYFDALEAEESLGNERGVAEAYNNIGVVYYYQKQIDKTINYFEKGTALAEQLKAWDLVKKGYNNIGALYDYQQKHEKALANYQKSYELSKKLEDKQEQAINLNNIAVSYFKMQQFDLAAQHHKQSLALKKALGDYHGAAYSYHNFASLAEAKGNFEEAERYYNKSLDLAKKYKLKEVESLSYKNLAELYAKKKNYQQANSFLQQHITARDSFLNEENTRAMAEMESKYEAAKKAKELLVKQTKIDKQQLEIKQKNIQLLLIGGLVVILFLIGMLIANYQYQKNKRLQKENELRAAKLEIEHQDKLKRQRLQISRDLHDNIGAQMTFIISSINNLKYKFKLRNDSLVKGLKGISDFVKSTTNELRDTIWAMNKEAISFEDLKNRIHNFINKARGAAADTAFHVEINTEETYAFSSVKGMNIYRIIQEAVNNALKYAEASVIKVVVNEKEDQLFFEIRDDGKGFDKEKVALGNGLHNMQKRAEEIAATFDLQSTSQGGTLVTFSVPKHYGKELVTP